VDAETALGELIDMGAGIRGAAVLAGDDAVLAVRGAPGLADDGGAGLWRAADEAARLLGRPAVQRFEVLGPEALVVGVREADRSAIAVADASATVGLIAYDLRSALRQLAEEPDGGG
jgi:hypothetical protein